MMKDCPSIFFPAADPASEEAPFLVQVELRPSGTASAESDEQHRFFVDEVSQYVWPKLVRGAVWPETRGFSYFVPSGAELPSGKSAQLAHLLCAWWFYHKEQGTPLRTDIEVLCATAAFEKNASLKIIDGLTAKILAFCQYCQARKLEKGFMLVPVQRESTPDYFFGKCEIARDSVKFFDFNGDPASLTEPDVPTVVRVTADALPKVLEALGGPPGERDVATPNEAPLPPAPGQQDGAITWLWRAGLAAVSALILGAALIWQLRLSETLELADSCGDYIAESIGNKLEALALAANTGANSNHSLLTLRDDHFLGGAYRLNAQGLIKDYAAAPGSNLTGLKGQNFSHRDYFKEAKNRPGPVVSEGFQSAHRNEVIVVLAIPVFVSGRFDGILDGVLDMRHNLLTEAGFDLNLSGLGWNVLDQKQRVVASDMPSELNAAFSDFAKSYVSRVQFKVTEHDIWTAVGFYRD